MTRFTRGICLAYDDLTPKDIFAMLKLRQDVFIVEQECIYHDIDHKDAKSHHFFLWGGRSESDGLMAYCRIVAPGVSYKEPSIGRVVSSLEARRHGWGKEMMLQVMAKIAELYPGQGVRISAQSYLQHFYESFGFEKVSEPYLEDDIPHIEMLKFN